MLTVSKHQRHIWKLLPSINRIQSYSFHFKFSSKHDLPSKNDENKFKVGNVINGYTLEKIDSVLELNLKSYQLVHNKTQAQHLHIEKNDDNNLLGILLRTPPLDDTGVAHILEHLVTCGSSQFACKDVFMRMTTRSLATFMNAFTGPDYTCYPFSSQNRKDFENLSKVYLDFVFHPLLNEFQFDQEAWRLEHQNINDKNSPLELKGVVYNEMKGSYSSSSQIYFRYLLKSLFPSNTYQYDFGGDPFCIPNLTHDMLKLFYSRYYHPSNSRFITYGNIPLEDQLSFIDNFILSKFDANVKIREWSSVSLQERWQASKEVTITCPPDPLASFPEKQTTASFSFLLEPITYVFENFVLSIIGTLLTSGQNAPFYKALIESGLGMDYSPGSGFLDFLKQTVFSIGLQGINENDVDKLKDLIIKTLEETEKNGFPYERIEALLHSIELSTKHQTTNFGLNLLRAINSTWLHDSDPAQILSINSNIDKFKKLLNSNPKFLQEKIRDHFLNNQHRLFLIMKPDEQYNKLRNDKEKQVLQNKIEKLTSSEKEKMYIKGLEMDKFKNEKNDVNCLPNLDINKDIPRKQPQVKLENILMRSIPVQISPQPTNDVTYFRVLFCFNYKELPKEMRPNLALFANLITKIGANQKSYKEMDQEIQLKTGGLSASLHFVEDPTDPEQYEHGMLFSSYCLSKNFESMLNLWSDIFHCPRFDEKSHLNQLIKIIASGSSESVPHSGHRYAMIRSASKWNQVSRMRERFTGLNQIFHLRNLLQKIESENLDSIFSNISKFLSTQSCLNIAINTEPSLVKSSLKTLEGFIDKLPVKSGIYNPLLLTKFKPTITHEHFIFPFSCNYIGQSLPFKPFSHYDFPKVKVLSHLLGSKYLLKEIREKGGAYGANASLELGGILNLYSYRDPNLNRTLECFKNAPHWLLKNDSYTEDDINEAKLSVFQSIDKPIPPGKKGMRQFLLGISNEKFHKFRLNILNVTKKDIMSVAEYYFNRLLPTITILGPESEETKNNSKFKIVSQVS